MKIIDCNAAFGHWPIQYLSHESLLTLHEDYVACGIDEAWISCMDAILAPEPDRSEKKFFAELEAYPRFRPVKTVNPLLANWRTSLYQSFGDIPLAAVKLFPNYHGYSLELSPVQELCQTLVDLGLPLLVQMRVNDERNQPTCMQVAGTNPAELVSLANAYPELTIIALSPYLGELLVVAKAGDNLMADLSYLDSTRVTERAKELFGISRLVFGSGAAWMVIRAAKLKLEYSSLPPREIGAIASANLLSRTTNQILKHA